MEATWGGLGGVRLGRESEIHEANGKGGQEERAGSHRRPRQPGAGRRRPAQHGAAAGGQELRLRGCALRHTFLRTRSSEACRGRECAGGGVS